MDTFTRIERTIDQITDQSAQLELDMIYEDAIAHLGQGSTEDAITTLHQLAVHSMTTRQYAVGRDALILVDHIQSRAPIQ